jgi:phosphoglucomutase
MNFSSEEKEILGQSAVDNIQTWLRDPLVSEKDKNAVYESVRSKNFVYLREIFYKHIEFGTGGLRGKTGIGTNQMNSYVIQKATQGFANHILNEMKKMNSTQAKVAIAYDSRNCSNEFAHNAACVLAANGISVEIFPTENTTPALSFAVRNLNCIGGLCLTASHNPPEYHGYKVYWSDGAQIVTPHDKSILLEIRNVQLLEQVKTTSVENAKKMGLLKNIESEVEDKYFNELKKLSLTSPSERDCEIKIVYTPLHGTGAIPCKRVLNDFGFKNLTIVPEQEKPDGNFPTVSKPNPEEFDALKMAIELSQKINADCALATDPDSDRLALVVYDSNLSQNTFKLQSVGNFVFLNGNQTGALLIDYILSRKKITNTLKPSHKIVKTIVTSSLLDSICKSYNVDFFNTLTGFKWIAALVREWEEKNIQENEFLFGTEESFGYMPGSYVRDKDGIGALALAVEMVSYYKKQGYTCAEKLIELFSLHGSWQEDLISIDLEGEKGVARIEKIMKNLREKPIRTLLNTPVIKCMDYKTQTEINLENGNAETKKMEPSLPISDVLQFMLADSSKISLRPSGTEPKLKIYTSVCTKSGTVGKASQQEAQIAYNTSIQKIALLRKECLAVIEGI